MNRARRKRFARFVRFARFTRAPTSGALEFLKKRGRALAGMEDAGLAQLVTGLVATLPRPRGATAGRLQRLLDPCVTIKLDGTRALLVWDGRTFWSHTVLGATPLHVDAEHTSDAFSVLDAELVGGHFYVFDALFVGGADVRHLPLMNRLRHVRACLPPCASIKRYYYGPASSLVETVKKLARSKPKMADGTRLNWIEGFILGSLTAPYDWAPLKFKYSVTYDFVVASEDETEVAGAQRLRLYLQQDQQLAPFQGCEDAPSTVLLEVSDLERLGLPTFVGIQDATVLEFKLVDSQWKAVRLRKDRQQPNSVRTIEENLELQRRGTCTIGFLLDHLLALHSAKAIVRNVRDAMVRALGVGAALLMGHAIQVLLMPTHSALQRQLDEAPETSPGLALIVPSIATSLGGRRCCSSALALHDVVRCSKKNGWASRIFTGMRARDFLVCPTAFPPDVIAALDDLIFLILRRVTALSSSEHAQPLL